MPNLQFLRKPGLRLVIALAIVLALFNPLASPPPVVRAIGPYVVDTASDGPDLDLNDNMCKTSGGGCSLRAAIQQATHDAFPTTITFAPGLANSILLLNDTYGTIIWAGNYITVDGGTGTNIWISGANLTGAKSIFQIQGNHNLLEHLSITHAPQNGVLMGDFTILEAGNYNTISSVNFFGNGAAGVRVHGGGSGNGGGIGNTIQFSIIGSVSTGSCGLGNNQGVFVETGADGTTIRKNWIICNTQYGVQISNTTGVTVSANSIGTNNVSALPNGLAGVYGSGTTGLNVSNNLISGNGQAGLWLDNSISATVRSNTIGAGLAGSAALANGQDGVGLANGSHNNTIGGVLAADLNLISGNAGNGVVIDGSGTHDNQVEGNFIGTNVTGTAAIANGQNGVSLRNDAHNNTVGGSDSAAERNVISGNTLNGVSLAGSHTSNNSVDDNFIGLNALGTAAVPNKLGGVAIFSANSNNIGGVFTNTAQYISGNVLQGIFVGGGAGGTIIGLTNWIGVAADGTTPLGNGRQGILLNGVANSEVGPHTVAYNGGAGVEIDGASATRNLIIPYLITSNGGLPVDLGGDGHTPNDGDVDIGPNDLLEYPVISTASGSVITGTVCANCTVIIYRASGDPAAPGGGGTVLSSVKADASGNWSATLSGGLTSANVSLVACGSACGFLGGDTSEMSPRPVLLLPLIVK